MMVSIYVTNPGSNTVSVIDTKTNTVNATIPVGNGPTGVAYDSDDGRVYVANSGSNSVAVIDTRTNTVDLLPYLLEMVHTVLHMIPMMVGLM